MKAFTLLIFLAVLLVGYGKSWDQQYEEWVQNPEPYGGLKVLEKIKKIKKEPVNSRELPAWLKIRMPRLHLPDNNISDITPLAGLTNLRTLHLHDNNISDLTPLAGLTNLQELVLNKNNISDLTPLAGLTNLKELWLHDNNVTDLTPLAGLTNLTMLGLDVNNISDLSPLVGLTELKSLHLYKNNISDSQEAMLKKALGLGHIHSKPPKRLAPPPPPPPPPAPRSRQFLCPANRLSR